MMLEFSLISNVETEFLKKVFNSSAIFLSSCSTSSFSTSFMLLIELPLFEKNGLIVFQNNLLSKEKGKGTQESLKRYERSQKRRRRPNVTTSKILTAPYICNNSRMASLHHFHFFIILQKLLSLATQCYYFSSFKVPIANFGILLNPPTTDPPTTDHLLTDPPTNGPPTHRPTDPPTQ